MISILLSQLPAIFTSTLFLYLVLALRFTVYYVHPPPLLSFFPCTLSLQGAVKQHFKEDFNNLFKHLVTGGGGRVTDDNMRSLLFGDYMNPDAVCFIPHIHFQP